MGQEAKNIFEERMAKQLGTEYSLRWETDRRGVVCGWCRLNKADDITVAAELVAGLGGRIMAITPLIPSSDGLPEHVEINYHFYFDGVNCTVRINLPDGTKNVPSITPILKSADWQEREMQELYNLKLMGHPNPKRLFLDSSIPWTDNTMIPLSEAMSGTSTNTLWERIMEEKNRGVKASE
jgi:NADH-quinone oxidoreductase subunit C